MSFWRQAAMSIVFIPICGALTAQAAPLTLDMLEKTSPAQAAQLALENALDSSVDTYPDNRHWNSGFIVFSKPEKALGFCSVLGLRVNLSLPGDVIQKIEEKDKYKPLKVSGFQAIKYYYFDGPQASACTGPVGHRPMFEAVTFGQAWGTVKEVRETIAAAASDAPLPFQLEVHCYAGGPCPDPVVQRARFAALKPQDIIKATSIEWYGEDGVDQVDFSSAGQEPAQYRVRFIYDGPVMGKLKKVEMYDNVFDIERAPPPSAQ